MKDHMDDGSGFGEEDACAAEFRPEGRIYLNNAATSFPKPDCVRKAVLRCMCEEPAGQYRSSEAADSDGLAEKCGMLLGRLLGIRDTKRFFFCSGATEAMNLVLSGLGIPAEQIITTVTEHNSVLRPLYNLQGIAGKPVLLSCGRYGYVDPELFEKEASRGRARAVILNHCSNVTGTRQDAEAFGEIAARYGLIFILDLSQSAGCMEVELDRWGAGIAVFTGHKSLLGLQGTGGFYVREGIPYRLPRYGGTGRDSEKLLFEPGDPIQMAGTWNGPGLAALAASVSWILEKGVGAIETHERWLRDKTLKELDAISGLRVCGDPEISGGPVVSFYPEHMDVSDLGYILSSGYGIVTRTGLHCAPLIHPQIGSAPSGTVRVSFSPFNSEKDVNGLADALREIF